jgi:hypothetical protein
MAKQKVDGIVEAVHYAPDGNVQWVRAYLRQGKVFGDHVLIPRQELITSLKQGKRFLTGQRKQYLGGVFDSADPVRVAAYNGQDILVVGEAQVEKDRLAGVPVI